jgi:hypothetical protein
VNSVLLPIFVFSIVLLAAASLACLAFRRKGLIPLDACSCGYPSAGNVTGTCPECGKFINEEIDKVQWRRATSLLKRSLLWAAAVALVAVPTTAGVLRIVGERHVIDCRTLMVPKDGSFRSVELTWKVRQGSKEGTLAGPVTVEIRSGEGVSTVKQFKENEGIDEWLQGVAVGKSLDAKNELSSAIKSAASGAQLILAGGSGSAFTMIANGSVSTVESRRWISGTAIAVSLLVLLIGLRTIFRRVMGRA